MNITEVRVSPRDDGKLRAFASITLDHSFVIRGLKIIEGQGRLFVAMPSRRRPDGSFQDVCHPISNDFRAELEEAVIEAYNHALENPTASQEM
ncbi:MAG: septation regulator SpoVG [Candidatus Eisenbacteria bacterium]|uniref:Septation regulator SpoVG n=1 Tax=Eiseniibacteriota bacterium TaxID=2212470 RepID=A0A7Y2H1D6_UNCEI|nr:septation regulator SpoVG [Candidatus Eisenbacteria bacterium]